MLPAAWPAGRPPASGSDSCATITGPLSLGSPTQARAAPAAAANPNVSWYALVASTLLGFASPAQEQAYQAWKQQRVAVAAPVVLWSQAALVVLPASVMWLHALLWMQGASAFAVAALTTLWAAAGQVPAAVWVWRRASYARHHDALWVLSALASAAVALGVPATGALPHFQLPGLGFKNMLPPAAMVYVVLPLLMALAPRWQLLASAAAYVNVEVTAAMAAEGAFPIGDAGHGVLLVASLAIACALEWRSRSVWLHARGAAPLFGPPSPVPPGAPTTPVTAEPTAKH